jgi:hypothetical protein
MGELSVIKIGLGQKIPVVIDDHDAFIVASRFNLQPLVFQDFIVRLTDLGLPKEQAIEIVQTTSRQFPAMYLAHTLSKLI